MLVRPVTRTVQSLALLALPHGGQRVARSNAWAATSAETAWARSRREAELAMHRALSAQTQPPAERESATR